MCYKYCNTKYCSAEILVHYIIVVRQHEHKMIFNQVWLCFSLICWAFHVCYMKYWNDTCITEINKGLRCITFETRQVHNSSLQKEMWSSRIYYLVSSLPIVDKCPLKTFKVLFIHYPCLISDYQRVKMLDVTIFFC